MHQLAERLSPVSTSLVNSRGISTSAVRRSDEEKVRACNKWKLFDWVMDQMVRGSRKFFEARFAAPKQAMRRLHKTVLMFSDQIPCWLKVAPDRQLFRKEEVQVKKRRKLSREEFTLQKTGQTLMSHKVSPQIKRLDN